MKKLNPISPGEILLEEFMQPFGLSMNRLALELHVPLTRVSEIVHGQRAITTDTALRLARFFGTTPQFWLNLQQLYDLQVAEQKDAAVIARQVQPLKAEVHSAG
jgi:addiction module HigA family antidote